MTALRRACTAGSRSLRYLLAIFLLGGTAMGGDALATTYRIVALTIPDDAKYGDAFDINATGDVVGTITTVDNKVRAVEWSPPDYAMRVLPLPADLESSVMNGVAINAAGDILGTNYGGSDWVGVVWKSDGSFQRLATTTAQGNGTAQSVADINGRGMVVGALWNFSDRAKPAIWTNPQTLRALLPVPRGTRANAVNDSGIVVGGLLNPGDFRHGFRWTPGGGVLDLGDLADGTGYSEAYDVNDSGQIVGYSTVSNPTPENLRAVLWDADGTMHDLGVLPDDGGHQGYQAYRINNFGEVLGNGDGRNWLWAAGAGMASIDSMIDPNDPLRSYGGIDMHVLNDAGVVVGGLVNYTIRTIPVMLVPQP